MMAANKRATSIERDALDADHPARDRLYEQARGVTHGIQEMGGLARDAAQEQFGQMGDAASAYYGQGRDRVCQVERSVEQYIRERPLQSVLIAAGVGAIAGTVGLLCGRYWMRR
jgi:ElaB/YqjD/DUF883 family membrane-anchored ribosome-binding protein